MSLVDFIMILNAAAIAAAVPPGSSGWDDSDAWNDDENWIDE